MSDFSVLFLVSIILVNMLIGLEENKGRLRNVVRENSKFALWKAKMAVAAVISGG